MIAVAAIVVWSVRKHRREAEEEAGVEAEDGGAESRVEQTLP